jgi:hypothetical protein
MDIGAAATAAADISVNTFTASSFQLFPIPEFSEEIAIRPDILQTPFQ